MSSRKIFALTALSLMIIAASAQAQSTYYVTTTGNDGNPGTPGAPFRSIQHAADIVNPGDTVLVGDGTYTTTGGNACGPTVVCLTRGGTAGAWVTFRSINRHGARLDGQSNAVRYGFQFLSNANYIRIDGFEVYGMGNASGDASGFVIYNAGHDVEISHNNIHDVGRLCTNTTNGETGIFLALPNVTVEENWIHDIGRFAPGENGCQPTGIQYTNHDHGVYVDGNSTSAGANNTAIVNNVFSNNARGWSIQVYPGSIASLSILNNTFSGPNPYSQGHIIVGASTTNGRIVNNVFNNPNSAAINFYAGTHSNLVVANNLSSRTIATARPGGVSFSNNLENTDPLLSSSFVPSSQSMAVDGGMAMPGVSTDMDGTSRPQGSGWDIGAYETGGAAAPAPASAPAPTTPTSAPAPAPAPASSAGCTTVRPGAGWTCYNGGWLPPGYPVPSAPVATSAAPATSAPVASSVPCTTVQPGAGWTCYNGGWLPPGYPIPSGVAPTAPASTTPTAGCTTVKPGPNWTCHNGGWLPPSSPMASLSNGAVSSAWSTGSIASLGSDPFFIIDTGVGVVSDWRSKNVTGVRRT